MGKKSLNWKKRYNQEVNNMTIIANEINKQAKVITEKFATDEDFEKAFNECQERIKVRFNG